MLEVKGYAAPAVKQPLAPFTFERRNLRDTDVLIDIAYCGVCHSDIHQARDEWGGALFPMVPGHEIVGEVKRIGARVKGFAPGDRVGVGCMVDSCRTCEYCEAGLEQYCKVGMVPTYNGRERDGAPTYGGYSTQIVVDQAFVLRLPKNLPMDATAPLLCAGITLYSPLHHWGAGLGKKVAIVGLGGLGHVGVKLARAMGAEVTVLSHSANKKADAERLGAHHFHATKDPATFTALASTLDLIISTVSVPMDWNAYLSLLRVDGTMVLLGVPEEGVPVDAFSLIGGRRRLAGSLIGGIAETQEMLDFCGKHNVVCDIERINIQDVNAAYDRVVKSDVKYRFVIDMASLKG
jgi:uncharacterized zinc-type alcohol dehydrogenase-like protein